MNCEDVQQELASGDVDPGLRHAVNSHVDACSACHDVRFFFARVDEALQSAPIWEPPAGFVQSVAVHGARLAHARLQSERGQSSRLVGRIFGSLSTAGYVGANLLAGIRVRMAGPAWVLRQYCALVVNTRN